MERSELRRKLLTALCTAALRERAQDHTVLGPAWKAMALFGALDLYPTPEADSEAGAQWALLECPDMQNVAPACGLTLCWAETEYFSAEEMHQDREDGLVVCLPDASQWFADFMCAAHERFCMD